jgi:drug/metabolite transporter (DMT)-like permease
MDDMKIMSSPNPVVSIRKLLLPFIGFIILIGGAPVAIRIIYSELAPFYMGFVRFGLAAIAFWLLTLYYKYPIPKGRALTGAVLFGVLGFGVPFALLAWGLVVTSASQAAILMALMPLITIFLSAFECVESLTMRGVFGSLLAIIGTVITVGGAGSANISLPHISAIIIGTGFLAQSGVVIKRYPANPPVITNAIAITIGAVILAIASLLAKEAWVIPELASTWVALSYMVVLVTIVAFILYLQVLNNWTASGTSYGFVIIPLVTVVIAAVLTKEQVTGNFIIGAVLLLAGVVIGALLPQKNKMAIKIRACN